MFVIVYAVLWLSATGFSAAQLFAYRGGVLATLATILQWVGIYFASTNVVLKLGGELTPTENPLALWIAVFMAATHFVVLLFQLFGVGRWADEQVDDPEGLATAATQMGDRL